MHEIIFDDSFCIEKTNDYILSIQVSLDGFSFSILHENQLLAFKNTLLKISNVQFIARRFQEWIEIEELLQQPFRNVNVIIHTHIFTLIPNELYSEEYKNELLLPLFETQTEIKTESQFIEKFNTHLLFAVPENLKQVLKDSFQQVTFLHALNTITNKLPVVGNNSLILFFNTQYLYILLCRENNLLLANSFKNTHQNDTIFFILTILKQFNISTKNTHLFLSGNQKQIEKAETELKKYFSEIEQLKPNSELNIPNSFPEINISRLITLP